MVPPLTSVPYISPSVIRKSCWLCLQNIFRTHYSQSPPLVAPSCPPLSPGFLQWPLKGLSLLQSTLHTVTRVDTLKANLIHALLNTLSGYFPLRVKVRPLQWPPGPTPSDLSPPSPPTTLSVPFAAATLASNTQDTFLPQGLCSWLFSLS